MFREKDDKKDPIDEMLDQMSPEGLRALKEIVDEVDAIERAGKKVVAIRRQR